MAEDLNSGRWSERAGTQALRITGPALKPLIGHAAPLNVSLATITDNPLIWRQTGRLLRKLWRIRHSIFTGNICQVIMESA